MAAGVDPDGVVLVGGDGVAGDFDGAGVEGDVVGGRGTGGDGGDVDGGVDDGVGGGVVGGGAVELVDGGNVGAGDASGGEADIILCSILYIMCIERRQGVWWRVFLSL